MAFLKTAKMLFSVFWPFQRLLEKNERNGRLDSTGHRPRSDSSRPAIRERRLAIASSLQASRRATKHLKWGTDAETSRGDVSYPPIFSFNFNTLAKYQFSMATPSPVSPVIIEANCSCLFKYPWLKIYQNSITCFTVPGAVAQGRLDCDRSKLSVCG